MWYIVSMKWNDSGVRKKLLWGAWLVFIPLFSFGFLQPAQANVGLGRALQSVLQFGRHTAKIGEALEKRSTLLAMLRRSAESPITQMPAKLEAEQLLRQAQAWVRHDPISLAQAKQEYDIARSHIQWLNRKLERLPLPSAEDTVLMEQRRVLKDELQLAHDTEELAHIRLVSAEQQGKDLTKRVHELEETARSPFVNQEAREAAEREIRVIQDLKEIQRPDFFTTLEQSRGQLVEKAKQEAARLRKLAQENEGTLQERIQATERYENAQRHANLLEGEWYYWQAALSVG